MTDDEQQPDDHQQNDDRQPQEPAASAPIGSVLSAAREAKGLTIADVAAATRLRSALVQAIEHDDFEAGGGAFYARAHLRTIARVVDADAEALVAEFDRVHGHSGARAELLGPAGGPPPALSAASVRRPAPRWAAAAVAVIVVLVAVLVVRAVSGGSGNEPTSQANSPSPTTSVEPSPTPKPTPTPTPKPTRTPTPTPKPKPTGVSLTVAVHGGQSWLQVKSSTGAVLYSGELYDGNSKHFADKSQLTAVFGHVPVVTVRINGAASTRPCELSVCTVQVNPSGSSLLG